MGHLKSVDLPERPGHKEVVATNPPQSKSRLWVIVVLIVLAGAGFWYFRSSHSAAANQEAAAGGRGGRHGGAGGANYSVPVVVAEAKRGDVPVYFNGLGTVTAYNTVTVRSRVDGQLINVAFKEGQFVNKGDLLAEIDPRPFQVQLEQAQGQLAKDQAQRNDAQAIYGRYQLLFKEGVIPQQQLDTQQAQVGQFDGAIKMDQAQIDNAKLQLTYCRITAPISGRIGLRLVDAGNIVHANDSTGLVVITQLQPISIIFNLPQDQLPQVNAKLRAGVQLTVDAYDRDNITKIATGKLDTIDNQIDPATGTYKLKSIFNNEDHQLFPNQFVNVHLLVDVRKNLTVVPASAIQRGPDGTYVYAVDQSSSPDSATAKIVPVTVAQTNDNTVGLSAGIEPGTLVVTDGQDKLQDGSKIVPSLAGANRGATSAENGGTQPPGENSGDPPKANARRGRPAR